MNVRELISGFLGRVRSLEAPETAWGYFLDLLDLIEEHRAELRGVAWPADFPELEAVTYRGLLLLCEDELRKLIIKLPLTEGEERDAISQHFEGLFASVTQRADAVVERLGSAPMH